MAGQHPPGVTPSALYQRVKPRHGSLTAGTLRRWLLAEQLADDNGGLLRATARCLDLAAGIDAAARFYPESAPQRRVRGITRPA